MDEPATVSRAALTSSSPGTVTVAIVRCLPGSPMAASRPAPIQRLAEIVGGENVLVDADLRAGHELDWTGRFRGTRRVRRRPRSAEEARDVLQLLAD